MIDRVLDAIDERFLVVVSWMMGRAHRMGMNKRVFLLWIVRIQTTVAVVLFASVITDASRTSAVIFTAMFGFILWMDINRWADEKRLASILDTVRGWEAEMRRTAAHVAWHASNGRFATFFDLWMAIGFAVAGGWIIPVLSSVLFTVSFVSEIIYRVGQRVPPPAPGGRRVDEVRVGRTQEG